MSHQLRLVAAPDAEPLTAAEARALLNIPESEVSDATLNVLIKAARQMFDGANATYGRAFITQTWDLTIDAFYGSGGSQESGFKSSEDAWSHFIRRCGWPGVTIPLSPLQSVTSITYLDTNGATQTVDPANYAIVQGEPAHVVLSLAGSWPATAYFPGAVTIRFIAGYGDAGSDVPQNARMAIVMQISHLRSLSQQNLFLSSEEIPGVISQSWTVGSGAGVALSSASAALMEGLRVLGE